MTSHHFTVSLLLHTLVLFPFHLATGGYANYDKHSSTITYSGTHGQHGSSSRGSGGSTMVRYPGQLLRNYSDDDILHRNVCTLQDCIPYIHMQVTIELNLQQKLQVHRKRRFIRRWRAAYKYRSAPTRIRHTSIVTLTPAQKTQILSQFGNYFSQAEELPLVSQIGTRQKRTSIIVCPREEQWDALVLGLTNDDELVQVIQFADTGDRQWILDERCTQNQCSFVSDCGCSAHTRLVRAAVISFDESVVAEKYIKVYCCVAKLLG
ncbi:uncharacterized protein LOC110979614 [Acanthaster planci]|uniref:Uncharacterized protein LOC110979614 n=1 Tax=Acanthaster planci TaxID=133434 RepID=A0A8B7YFV8_ACAPL|nr:uncharacterized protein LOC110979614 [Acanthaster planci]